MPARMRWSAPTSTWPPPRPASWPAGCRPTSTATTSPRRPCSASPRRPELGPRAGRQLRAPRRHPDPGGAARRAARRRLGQPLGPLAGPAAPAGRRGADRAARPGPDPGRAGRRARHRPPGRAQAARRRPPGDRPQLRVDRGRGRRRRPAAERRPASGQRPGRPGVARLPGRCRAGPARAAAGGGDRLLPGPTAAWPSAGPPTTRPSPPARTSGPGWTRPRGPCWSGPPRPAWPPPLRPESLFRQRIRLARSLVNNISVIPPAPPLPAPFQTVCSVRTMARTVCGE
jgi:hypothetical protein